MIRYWITASSSISGSGGSNNNNNNYGAQQLYARKPRREAGIQVVCYYSHTHSRLSFLLNSAILSSLYDAHHCYSW